MEMERKKWRGEGGNGEGMKREERGDEREGREKGEYFKGHSRTIIKSGLVPN